MANHWHRSRSGHDGAIYVRTVKKWAQDLIELRDTKAIASPILLEFLAGATNARELELYRAFIGMFEVVDEGRIPKEDWASAKAKAERIPRDGKRRQLGDCLIRAIADRLRYEVDTNDVGFPR